MTKDGSIATTAGLALLLAACASQPPRPTEALEAAGIAVGKAAAGKLEAAAQPDLARARDKLAAAKAAAAAQDYQQARRLAEQARADAELAMARTDEARASAMLRSLQAGAAP